jgi:hypothetical protein
VVSWRSIALVAAGLVAALAFSVAYVGAEHTIYTWDYAGFFNLFREYGQRFSTADWTWIRSVVDGVRYADYNPSSIVPLLPVYGLFGGTRAVYIAALVGMYLIPAAILAAATAKTAMQTPVQDPRLPAWILVSALVYWPLWVPTLRGFPDVAALLPLGAATLLLWEPGRLRERPVLLGMLIGLLVWLVFVLRRWYAYSCASLLFVAGAVALWRLLVNKHDRASRLRHEALLFGACGATMGLLLLAQWPIVRQILTTSYAAVYEAYSAPLARQFAEIFALAGPLVTVGVVAGTIRAVVMRQPRMLFLIACVVLSFVLFSRTQAPGLQHMLPWFFWLFPVFINGVSLLGRLSRYPGVIWLVPSCMALCFATVFIPGARASLAAAEMFWPPARIYPLKMERLESYQLLADDLLQRLAEDDRFTVFASSEDLADEMLIALDPVLGKKAILAGDVDQRDGLLKAALEARFAVVTSPVALHLPPEYQRLVSVPNQHILEGTGFGAGYERVAGPFRLAGDKDAYVYGRTRPLSTDDWTGIRDQFMEMYPAWRETPQGLTPGQ